MKKHHKKSIEENIFDSIVGLAAVPFKRKKFSNNRAAIDKEKILEKWQKIEELVKLGGESRFKQAVIEADKLFDAGLIVEGVKGETMGERLKNAEDKFDREIYQDLWKAHKVRNDIVHAHDRELLSGETENTLRRFKEALKELGLI